MLLPKLINSKYPKSFKLLNNNPALKINFKKDFKNFNFKKVKSGRRKNINPKGLAILKKIKLEYKKYLDFCAIKYVSPWKILRKKFKYLVKNIFKYKIKKAPNVVIYEKSKDFYFNSYYTALNFVKTSFFPKSLYFKWRYFKVYYFLDLLEKKKFKIQLKRLLYFYKGSSYFSILFKYKSIKKKLFYKFKKIKKKLKQLKSSIKKTQNIKKKIRWIKRFNDYKTIFNILRKFFILYKKKKIEYKILSFLYNKNRLIHFEKLYANNIFSRYQNLIKFNIKSNFYKQLQSASFCQENYKKFKKTSVLAALFTEHNVANILHDLTKPKKIVKDKNSKNIPELRVIEND